MPGSRVVLAIANGPDEHRLFYKGIDLLIDGFIAFRLKNNYAKLIIVGTWSDTIKKKLTNNIDKLISNDIIFVGEVPNVYYYITKADVSIHCARGDSFPTSKLETMAFGIPTIVSNTTGTSSIVSLVNNNWVINPSSFAVSHALEEYFNTSDDVKMYYSSQQKKILNNYKEEIAIDNFKKLFKKDNL